jgi:uncharacterized protein involved in exopolysaccharide biosynthesis
MNVSLMNSSEFSPTEYFSRIIAYWWVVLLAASLGAAFGFIFYHLHPPVYEATATYFITLDLTRMPTLGVREDLIQYNEDMALSTTQGALLSTDVLNSMVNQARGLGQLLSVRDLLDNSTIERKHDIWELRYRSEDPATAQAIVNAWAQTGYQAMLSWQASGKAPDYVVFQPPTQATLPEKPVLYGLNNLVLAGALIGFIWGIIISILLSNAASKPHPVS